MPDGIFWCFSLNRKLLGYSSFKIRGDVEANSITKLVVMGEKCGRTRAEEGFREGPDERITKGNEKRLRVINTVHILTLVMASCVYTYVKFYQMCDIHCGSVIPQ